MISDMIATTVKEEIEADCYRHHYTTRITTGIVEKMGSKLIKQLETSFQPVQQLLDDLDMLLARKLKSGTDEQTDQDELKDTVPLTTATEDVKRVIDEALRAHFRIPSPQTITTAAPVHVFVPEVTKPMSKAERMLGMTSSFTVPPPLVRGGALAIESVNSTSSIGFSGRSDYTPPPLFFTNSLGSDGSFGNGNGAVAAAPVADKTPEQIADEAVYRDLMANLVTLADVKVRSAPLCAELHS